MNALAIDDCWNHIGVQGNATCPELQAHIHCRNCRVYSSAARRLLDVPLPEDHLRHWTQHFAKPRAEREHNTESVLILRSSSEWLALPTTLCLEVASHRPIHSLPHRRNPAVLGLTNIRGELIACLSLAALLGVQPSAAPDNATRRILLITSGAAPTALQVDEIHGTHRFNPREVAALPDTLATAAVRNTRAVLRWRDRTVGVLDDRALLESVARSLA